MKTQGSGFVFIGGVVVGALVASVVGVLNATQGSTAPRVINLPGRTVAAPFSDAVLAGNTLYVAGRLGMDPQTGRQPATAEQEARNVLDGVQAVLAEAGMTMDDLVNVQVFCSDVSLYGVFNRCTASTSPARPRPAPSSARARCCSARASRWRASPSAADARRVDPRWPTTGSPRRRTPRTPVRIGPRLHKARTARLGGSGAGRRGPRERTPGAWGAAPSGGGRAQRASAGVARGEGAPANGRRGFGAQPHLEEAAHSAPRREWRGAKGSPRTDAGGLGRSPIWRRPRTARLGGSGAGRRRGPRKRTPGVQGPS